MWKNKALTETKSKWNHVTRLGRVTHLCVSKQLGSDYGLSPGRRQAIIWTTTGILFIWNLGTNFCEILIEIYTFSFKKVHLKMSSGKWRPFCLDLNVLKTQMATFSISLLQYKIFFIVYSNLYVPYYISIQGTSPNIYSYFEHNGINGIKL